MSSGLFEFRCDRQPVSNPVIGFPRVPGGLQTGVLYGWATIQEWRITVQMRTLALLCLLFGATYRLQAAEILTIHGRAHAYGGDGQLRIWLIGAHHEYEPDESSLAMVAGWLEAGVKKSERDEFASSSAASGLFHGGHAFIDTEPRGCLDVMATTPGR
jgi:hypothetical protein